MADLDKIMTALRNAHAAGDAVAAKRLAAMAKAAQGGGSTKPPPSDAMGEGMAKLSGMSQNPTVDPKGRTTGQMIYDNLIGDPTDGVDSYGESLGRGINDVAKAGAAGAVRGGAALLDTPGAIVSGYGDLVSAGLSKSGLTSPEFAAQVGQGIKGTSPAGTGTMTREAAAALTGGGSEYKGKTTAGEYAGTVGEFLPGAALMGGMSPGNLVKYGAIPAVTSEAAGQMTEGTGWENAARVGGALVGGMLPDLAMKGMSKLLSPNGGADPERLKLAAVLDDFGVPISAGQRVGNEALRRKEGMTSAGQNLSATQKEAFTVAALKTAGIEAKRATAEVLDEAAKRIGSVFDDVTRGVDVTPDANAMTSLAGAVNTYKSLAPTSNQAPLVGNILKDVTKAFRGGNVIPAATVNTWRSSLSKLTTSADAATREAANAALEAVDDMLTRALNAAGKADDVARLATARGQWRNFLAIQKAATGAGEATAAGLLSPAQLRSAVVQQGRSAFARGKRGDIGDLARAGVGVMDDLRNSGTPAGLRAMIPGGSLPAALGAGVLSPMGPMAAAGGALAGMMLPAVTGAIRMSGPAQAYLANQMVPNYLSNLGRGMTTALLPFAGEARNALAVKP